MGQCGREHQGPEMELPVTLIIPGSDSFDLLNSLPTVSKAR